ncbi:hypothetical protein E3T26_05180 [Cryobacterium sp. TMT1-21]|uniref:Uncharacterized protein n=1 Tax=Cryobacterium shii TaxID=1259235 RepID=A0AAQ2C3C1_9MICO|nr:MULTISPECIES: hypothetical protein [Cryobacterium]TFC41141.1 hypothetical protein E3O49_16035 [Cryobacterium shii]TFD15937.1 hypothetical protein E3T26_05180 [Cryobacterium sp. TMT1-21]TFD19785.1 hypothetical protein E3T32_10280 [Cryobacterium sp. TMT2-23]TFD43419.1 hypothetical protein E3T37_00930 [Cryobacterium sp. TMT2-10]
MTDFYSGTPAPTRTLDTDPTQTLVTSDFVDERGAELQPEPEQPPAPERAASAAAVRRVPSPAQRTALVVLVAIGALALVFIVMLVAGVSSESINALAVFATPIASMVAAYYGITLSIQQVGNERAEKEKALARADAADAASRETEVWASQMESGLRVAVAQLTAARMGTDAVTKAAGTPDGFF